MHPASVLQWKQVPVVIFNQINQNRTVPFINITSSGFCTRGVVIPVSSLHAAVGKLRWSSDKCNRSIKVNVRFAASEREKRINCQNNHKPSKSIGMNVKLVIVWDRLKSWNQSLRLGWTCSLLWQVERQCQTRVYVSLWRETTVVMQMSNFTF